MNFVLNLFNRNFYQDILFSYFLLYLILVSVIQLKKKKKANDVHAVKQTIFKSKDAPPLGVVRLSVAIDMIVKIVLLILNY